MRNKYTLISAITVIAYVFMIGMNAFANILPFNGRTTGEISDMYGNLFAPPAYVFSIWGVIYILLLVYTIYQLALVKSDNVKLKQYVVQINGFFIISSITNGIWMLSWHYDYIIVTVLLMLILLIVLIAIQYEIDEVFRVENAHNTIYGKYFISIPFTVYQGWITVALVANIVTLLVKYGVEPYGVLSGYITAGVLLIVGVIGVLVLRKFKRISYGVVIVWAVSGIFVKHISSTGFNGEYIPVLLASALVVVAILISMVAVYRSRVR